MPDGAGIVQPATDPERAATEAFLGYGHLLGADDKEVRRRLIAGQKWCAGR